MCVGGGKASKRTYINLFAAITAAQVAAALPVLFSPHFASKTDQQLQERARHNFRRTGKERTKNDNNDNKNKNARFVRS